MCDVKENAYFSQKKDAYKWAKHGFATQSFSRRDSLESGKTLTLK